MLEYETLTFGSLKVKRIHAAVTSPTLLALPEAARPVPLLGCTTCPLGSWYLDEEERPFCHCEARRYVSWTTNQKMITLCDDREVALMEQATEPDN
ncbi:MAG: hypothetical protein J0J06_13995 [Sphingomonas sp.]|uniref:hypothetical protein n=1 Tax=Sphingomonas sp. TaxID=28214 RepID=UPI001AC4E48D|nr:hypothetical protein [Sphingomonas sp.]MBN8816547.1 hypothetical protein [Sphingomonas sp.]